MLTKYLQYFIAFIISSCFTVQAMDSHQNLSEEALEEFNKIVCHGFPLPQYNSDDLLFSKPKKELMGKENAGLFESMDGQTTVLFMHPLSPRDFLNFGQTCQFLHALSLSPCFYLNEFCLQEGMPRSMPVDIIVSKALRSKKGIINLATLYSVSKQDLKKWFKKSELEQALQPYGTIPDRLVGLDLDNAQVEGIFPVIKIAKAVENDPNLENIISRLVYSAEMYPFMSIESPGISAVYPGCQILKLFGSEVNFEGQVIDDMENGIISYNHQTIEVLIRDLLLSPMGIPSTVSKYITNPKKSDTVIKLIQWCSKYSFGLAQGRFLVVGAMRHQQKELAFEMCKKVLEQKQDNVFGNSTANKADALLALEKDERVKGAMTEFAQETLRHWQGNHWNPDPDVNTKKSILRIFLRTGLVEGLNEQYVNLCNDPRSPIYPDDDLIEDFFNFGQAELGCDLIHRNLTENSQDLLPRIHNIILFTQRIVNIDRTRFLPLLKEKMVSRYHITEKLLEKQAKFLLGLISCTKEEEDIQYVTSMTNSFCQMLQKNNALGVKTCRIFATIYFHLNHKELTESFYYQWIKHLLKKHTMLQEYEVYKLNNIGLNLTKLEDLESKDPFDVIATIWQAECHQNYKG